MFNIAIVYYPDIGKSLFLTKKDGKYDQSWIAHLTINSFKDWLFKYRMFNQSIYLNIL